MVLVKCCLWDESCDKLVVVISAYNSTNTAHSAIDSYILLYALHMSAFQSQRNEAVNALHTKYNLLDLQNLVFTVLKCQTCM